MFTTIDVPSSVLTSINGNSDTGQITGEWIDAAGLPHGFVGTPVGQVRECDEQNNFYHVVLPGTGEIRGTDFNDLNGDGFEQGNEPGLSGWTIYLDQNHNGRRDPDERFTTTDASGNYSFPNLAQGDYTVAEESQPGWIETAPITKAYTLTIQAGQVLSGNDFGNQQNTEVLLNRPPAFTSTPSTTATVGQLLRYNASASDPDRDPRPTTSSSSPPA